MQNSYTQQKMSQGSHQDYVTNEVRIGKQGVKLASTSTDGTQLDEETSAVTAKLKDEMCMQHVVVKQEVVDDVDSEGEEYYILADGMEMVEISGDLRAALSAEDPNGEDSSHYVLVGASSTSNAFAAIDNNGQSVKSNKSPLYIDVCASKEDYNSEMHNQRLDFSERFNLKTPSSFRHKSNDYDSQMYIYPVQDKVQTIEGNRMYLENTGSLTRKFHPNKGNSHPFQISDYTELWQMRQSGKVKIQSMQNNETHPFKCEECGESFELKSRFVMHELGHEKYKFYSFRTNTVKIICVQCKKPYLQSANDKQLNSNMCIPCMVKQQERMMLYSTDKVKESGTKRLLELPVTSNTPKVKKRKQCYSCGRRSDRYFVYGASLLCSECWQDRVQRAKRSCKSIRTALQRGSYQRHNSAFTRYEERCSFKSQVPHFQYQQAEENPNHIGTHFLLSAFGASHINRVEEKDDDVQEIQEDCSRTEISAYEDESYSNTVILCDRTGEFIDVNC